LDIPFSKKLETIKNLSEEELRNTIATLLRYFGFRHVRVTLPPKTGPLAIRI